nr:nucleotide exchange factor GrpE [uncultured Acetatifactor sp.]
MAEQEKEKLKEGSEEIKASQEGPEDCADSAAQETAEDERDCAEKENEEDAREEETASSGSSESGMTWAEKKAAKKQAKMDKKADSYKEKIDQLEDRVKRQMAEFENFRKRTDREKQAMFETGAKSVIEKILPVVDNFERGLASVSQEKLEDPFVDGMNRVYKQLLKELDGLGVKPIEAVGCEFDPNLHNAVMQVESEEYDSGVIAQELQKGYTYRDTVVRHSMVAVVE